MGDDAPKKITWQENSRLSTLLIGTAVGFVVLAIVVGGKLVPLHFFWVFVPLPGCIGLANYFVTSRHRDAEHETGPDRPEGKARAEAKAEAETEEQHRPTVAEAVAAALLLTAVFGVVALSATSSDNGMQGLTYAGYGAYISTLWLMLVRLNASALSPRFLMNGALKASIAMLIGYMASANNIFTSRVAMPSVCFFVGLFHAFALKALQRMAMATFGMTQQTGPADLSVRLLEGVDDGAADVLEELGITSVQHLATMHAAEVCGRSLYPRNRVLDWIDQAILAIHTNGRINDLRPVGIRSAYALVTTAQHTQPGCALKEAADERFEEAAKRLGLTCGGLLLTVECIRQDPAYIALEEIYPNRHKRVAPESKASSKPATDSPGVTPGGVAVVPAPPLSVSPDA